MCDPVGWNLKNAVYEEFGEGKVMRSMRLQCKGWWQVRDFKTRFKEVWMAYTQVSYFFLDFVRFSKSQMLVMHDQVCLECAKAQSIEEKATKLQASLTVSLLMGEVVRTSTLR